MLAGRHDDSIAAELRIGDQRAHRSLPTHRSIEFRHRPFDPILITLTRQAIFESTRLERLTFKVANHILGRGSHGMIPKK